MAIHSSEFWVSFPASRGDSGVAGLKGPWKMRDQALVAMPRGWRLVHVVYDPPPAPLPEYTWYAVDDGYDGAARDPVGRGETALEAVIDLHRKLTEDD